MKSTKIIATIGPASDSVESIQSMHKAGMNIARLNFSHGSHEYFTEIIKRIKSVSDDIAIMLDTKGPQIRTMDGECKLIEGDQLKLTNKNGSCTDGEIHVSYNNLHKLEIGNRILFDDGLIEAELIEHSDDGLKIKILNSGKLEANKTVTFKGHNVDIPFISARDRADIEFGINNDVDFVAASFVRTKDDVVELKELLKNTEIPVISKIEHWQSVENIQEIVEESFGVMVARGDLGVEVSLEKVPQIQMDIIIKCNRLGRPVIVATQMLESMRDNPRPTRAEVSDVSQAIIQGADAIMLSGETASGKYPVKAVEMMSNISSEYDILANNHLDETLESHDGFYSNPVSLFVTRAAFLAQKTIGTKAILTPTETGYTPRKVSRFKPKCPIFAVTGNRSVFMQLQLSWGVYPIHDSMKYTSKEQYTQDLIKLVVDRGLLIPEDRVVVTAGIKMHEKGYTNHLGIYTVGDII